MVGVCYFAVSKDEVTARTVLQKLQRT